MLSLSKAMTAGDLWADSGCVRGVGGEKEHINWARALKELGLKPLVAPCQEQFQFGDGNVVAAHKKYFYPTFLEGKYFWILGSSFC